MKGARSTLTRVQAAARAAVDAENLLRPLMELQEQGTTWDALVHQRMRELEHHPPEDDAALLAALPDEHRLRFGRYSDARGDQQAAGEEVAYLFGLSVGLAMSASLRLKP